MRGILAASALIIGPAGRWRDSLCVLLQATNAIAGILQADDGRSGWQLIVKSRPTLLLLDAGLPGDEAWPLLEQVRKLRPPVRCIVLARTSAQAQRAEAAGADAVLQVGFSGKDLYAAIREVCCE